MSHLRVCLHPLSQYVLEAPLAAITAVSLWALRALHTSIVQYLPILSFYKIL
jgi:hypothetical protein